MCSPWYLEKLHVTLRDIHVYVFKKAASVVYDNRLFFNFSYMEDVGVNQVLTNDYISLISKRFCSKLET